MVHWLEFLPPTSEAAGLNLGPGASCWKVGSYLLMPGGLQCSMHWFPPPVKLGGSNPDPYVGNLVVVY